MLTMQCVELKSIKKREIYISNSATIYTLVMLLQHIFISNAITTYISNVTTAYINRSTIIYVGYVTYISSSSTTYSSNA